MCGSNAFGTGSHSLLEVDIFERGYNDLISKSYDMLPRLTAYLHDNPRRLAIRREHPDLFRIHRKTGVCGLLFTSLGNHFLLDWPERQLVEISSRLLLNERDFFVYSQPLTLHGIGGPDRELST